jgi:hypothetical protein
VRGNGGASVRNRCPLMSYRPNTYQAMLWTYLQGPVRKRSFSDRAGRASVRRSKRKKPLRCNPRGRWYSGPSAGPGQGRLSRPLELRRFRIEPAHPHASFCVRIFGKASQLNRHRIRPANRPPSVAILCVGPLCVPAVCRPALCVGCVPAVCRSLCRLCPPWCRFCRPYPPRGRDSSGAARSARRRRTGPVHDSQSLALSQSAAVGGAILMGSRVPPAHRETGRGYDAGSPCRDDE